MKLCKDCKHCVPYAKLLSLGDLEGAIKNAKCGMFPSAVDGSPEHYCSISRTYSVCCGQEGKHWEEREFPIALPEKEKPVSFWTRVKKLCPL